MPNPTTKEKHGGKHGLNHYMSRCVPMLIKEGKKNSQAIAICESMYRQSKKRHKAKGNLDLEPDFDKENQSSIATIIPPNN